jgi:hypothetical protein
MGWNSWSAERGGRHEYPGDCPHEVPDEVRDGVPDKVPDQSPGQRLGRIPGRRSGVCPSPSSANLPEALQVLRQGTPFHPEQSRRAAVPGRRSKSQRFQPPRDFVHTVSPALMLDSVSQVEPAATNRKCSVVARPTRQASGSPNPSSNEARQ